MNASIACLTYPTRPTRPRSLPMNTYRCPLNAAHQIGYFFSKFGECSNPECMYLHIDPTSKLKECAWYARGFCRHGPSCKHKHVRKAVCQAYLTGFCPKGPECPFGHPKYELPIVGEDPQGTGSTVPLIPSTTSGFRSLSDVTCFKCMEKGHYANQCPKRRKTDQ